MKEPKWFPGSANGFNRNRRRSYREVVVPRAQYQDGGAKTSVVGQGPKVSKKLEPPAA